MLLTHQVFTLSVVGLSPCHRLDARHHLQLFFFSLFCLYCLLGVLLPTDQLLFDTATSLLGGVVYFPFLNFLLRFPFLFLLSSFSNKLQHGVQVLELMARDVFGLELAENVLRLPALPLLLFQHQLAELVTLRLQQIHAIHAWVCRGEEKRVADMLPRGGEDLNCGLWVGSELGAAVHVLVCWRDWGHVRQSDRPSLCIASAGKIEDAAFSRVDSPLTLSCPIFLVEPLLTE